MTGRGTLILVVGPSGAGKDSIIAGAAERLRDNPKLVFARRVITRPPEAGGENHLALSSAEFADWRNAGRFMLHWPRMASSTDCRCASPTHSNTDAA